MPHTPEHQPHTETREKKSNVKKYAGRGCLTVVFSLFGATGACLLETDGFIDDYDHVEQALEIPDQTYERPFIPGGLSQCAEEYTVANALLPIAEADRDEVLDEGETAVAYQVTEMTREQLEAYFGHRLELEDGVIYTVVLFIFTFVEDNGARQANFVVNNEHSVTITEKAFEDLDTVLQSITIDAEALHDFNEVLEDGIEFAHPGDLELAALIGRTPTIDQAIDQELWKGERPNGDGFVFDPQIFLAKRHNNGWAAYPFEVIRLLDNHPLLMKADKNAFYVSAQDVQNSGIRRFVIGPVSIGPLHLGTLSVDISGDIPRSGRLIYWNLPEPTAENPCSQNVGEENNQLLPFANSPENLHPKLRQLNLWERRPWGNSSSSARLIRTTNK